MHYVGISLLNSQSCREQPVILVSFIRSSALEICTGRGLVRKLDNLDGLGSEI